MRFWLAIVTLLSVQVMASPFCFCPRSDDSGSCCHHAPVHGTEHCPHCDQDDELFPVDGQRLLPGLEPLDTLVSEFEAGKSGSRDSVATSRRRLESGYLDPPPRGKDCGRIARGVFLI